MLCNKTLIYTKIVTGWLVIILMIVFIITGYSMAGKFGMNFLIDPTLASFLHEQLSIPMIISFVLHFGICIGCYRKMWCIGRNHVQKR